MRNLRSDEVLQTLVRGATPVFAARIAGAVAAFGFHILAARHLGAGGLGIYYLGLAVVMIASMLARLGLDNAPVGHGGSVFIDGHIDKPIVVGFHRPGDQLRFGVECFEGFDNQGLEFLSAPLWADLKTHGNNLQLLLKGTSHFRQGFDVMALQLQLLACSPAGDTLVLVDRPGLVIQGLMFYPLVGSDNCVGPTHNLVYAPRRFATTVLLGCCLQDYNHDIVDHLSGLFDSKIYDVKLNLFVGKSK